jgi:hypothetical protein
MERETRVLLDIFSFRKQRIEDESLLLRASELTLVNKFLDWIRADEHGKFEAVKTNSKDSVDVTVSTRERTNLFL